MGSLLPISSHNLSSYLLGETDTLKVEQGCNYLTLGSGLLLGAVGIKIINDNRVKNNNRMTNDQRNKSLVGLSLLVFGGGLAYCSMRN